MAREKDTRGREKVQRKKDRNRKVSRDSPSPKRRSKGSSDKVRDKDRKQRRKASPSSESSSDSSGSSSYSSSASSSSYSSDSSDSSSGSSDSESSSSSASSSDGGKGRKSKKQISKGKRVKDAAQRRSREKADSVPDSKSKVVEREASPHVSHKQKDIVMASPPPVKQETEPEKKEIKVERAVLEEKVNKDRVVESTEIRKDLPKSYQREARKPSPDSGSDESAKAKSPARKRLVSASDHSSSESPPRRRSRSKERGKSASASPRRRKRSPSPVATKIHVGNLTRNVNKDHITEIFSIYGKVRHVEMPVNRNNLVLRNYAYIEYEGPMEAEKAVKHMDGGWIDGQEVQTKLILPMKDRRRPSPGRFNPRNRRRSPPRPRQPQRNFNRRSRTPPRRRSPSPGARRRSPRRSRSPVRRRSRSPVRGNFRRRRGSVSTESSRSRSPVRRVGRQRSRSASVSRRRRFSRSSTSS